MHKIFIVIAVVSVILSSCQINPKKGDDIVNVYTHRHYDTDQKLFDRFTEETGIKVNVVSASADELIQKMELEGSSSPADVLITVDAGRLARAQEKGLLQQVESDILKANVPGHLRHPDGYWFGLTYRARIIVYSLDRVDVEDLSTYEDLVDKKWEGRILTRSSENIYNQSLLASIIAHKGSAEAETWAAGVLKNMARNPKGNDRDQIIGVASSLGDIAIVNTYYVGLMLNDKNKEMRNAAESVGIFFPNQEDRGTHINISGAGVAKHSPNPENAVRFIEYLSDKTSQELFAQVNYEYPVNAEVEWSDLFKEWGQFKADSLNLSKLGEHNNEAVIIFDKINWK